MDYMKYDCYECDPAKNSKCSKTACFEKGGECHLTGDPAAARDQPMEVLVSVPRKSGKTLRYVRRVVEMSDLLKIKAGLEELRHFAWLRDIPSPTCPEYIEHHQSIQEILGKIDAIISEVDDMILGLEDDCK